MQGSGFRQHAGELIAASEIVIDVRGINLRIAIVQNAIHHVFYLGEIVAKRELMGYDIGSFPGAFGAALMGVEYDDWSKRQSS